MTATVSGGHVWRMPTEKSSSTHTPKVAKRNIVFLGLSSVSGIIGAIIMCMARPNRAEMNSANEVEGAIPVIVNASAVLPIAPAIAMIIACLVSMTFLVLAGRGRGLRYLTPKALMLSFAAIVIPLLIMVIANFSLLINSIDESQNSLTKQWVQEHYNLTLAEPLDGESGQVEAKNSKGDTVKLNVLHFNGSTYVYQNDEELLGIMEKLKK